MKAENLNPLELCEIARLAFVEARKTGVFTVNNVSNLIVVDDEPKPHVIGNTACHAGLGYTGENNIQVICSGLQNYRIRMNKYSEDEIDIMTYKYLDWLLNRSPWSPTFIIKDANKVIKDECIYSGTDHYGAFVVGGSIAARALSEYPRIVYSFHKLTEAGCNENMAFLVSHKYSSFSGNGVVYTDFIQGHTSIYIGNIDQEGLINFLNGVRDTSDDDYRDKIPYHELPVYRDLRWVFSKGDSTNYFSNLINNTIDNIKVDNTKTLTNINPFGIPTGAKNLCVMDNNNKTFARIANALNELVEEVLKDAV